jgi:O-antigen/teichoic acid export membrane protein
MIFSGIATAGTAIAAFFLIPGHAIIGASVTMIVTSGLMLICYLGGVLYLIHHHNKKKTE